MLRPISRFEMVLYALAWRIAAPAMWVYFTLRSRKDPRYGAYWPERFGHGPFLEGAIWVHATSLGELRSAAPVIDGLLARGYKVMTTHHTPAGRDAAETSFSEAIETGQLIARWVPLEYPRALRRFLEKGRPALCLVMEIDVWPLMIWEAKKAGVPFWLCNTQYLTKSFERDHEGGTFRGRSVAMFDGAMTKSDLHTARFNEVGLPDVVTVGETRFEQIIPEPHLNAAETFRTSFSDRPVIGLVNTVDDEETVFLTTLTRLRNNQSQPVFVVVPRAPERFEPMFQAVSATGHRALKRSDILDAELCTTREEPFDVLLGDSFGEMYFYLSLCDIVVMGGSFTPKGSHNVIEPLALGKPVIVGPHTWTIDYPVEEAIEAGAVKRVQSGPDLMPELLRYLDRPADFAEMIAVAPRFFSGELGATERILAKVGQILGERQ